MKRSHRLLALSLLLLMPLSVAKLRADAPRSSRPSLEMDRLVNSAWKQNSSMGIEGYGPLNKRLMRLKDTSLEGLIVKDPTALRAMAETLRCTDRWFRVKSPGSLKSSLRVSFSPSSPAGTHSHYGMAFLYWRDAHRSYLLPDEGRGYWSRCAVVQPRFVPKFEALVTRLAQRAQAPGNHPEIVFIQRVCGNQ